MLFFLQTLGVIAAIIIPIVLYLKQRQKKVLSYEIVSDTPLLSVKEEIKTKLQILFEGKPVQQVYLGMVRVFNSGNMPIEVKDYDCPITLCFGEGAQILTAEIVKTDPNNLRPSINVKNNEIVISPILLNRGDFLTLKILATTSCDQMVVNGRIVGVKEIKQFTGVKLRYYVLASIGIIMQLMGYFLPSSFPIPQVLFIAVGGILALFALIRLPASGSKI